MVVRDKCPAAASLGANTGEGKVDFDFTSSKLAKLPKKERIAKCQQLASQAEKLGQHAIANQWRQLAAEIEAADQNLR